MRTEQARSSHMHAHPGRYPDELYGLDPAELVAGEEDEQLAAHGPDGDGAISSVGAEAEGLCFAEPPEVATVAPDDERLPE